MKNLFKNYPLPYLLRGYLNLNNHVFEKKCSGTRMSYEKNSVKQLPCITFCFQEGYKESGSGLVTETSYQNGTYSLEDLFLPQTLKDLKNGLEYFTTEISTLGLGRCQTVCNLEKKMKKDGPILFLKANHDITVFVHLKGEEIWLNNQLDSPITIASTLIEIKSRDQFFGAVMLLGEIDTSVLSKEEEPCKAYSKDEANESDAFIQCSKNALWNNITQEVKCWIPQMKGILMINSTLPACNMTAGNATFEKFNNLFDNFAQDSNSLGCPAPCKQISYKLSVEYYHENTWFYETYPYDTSEAYFPLKYYYDTLNVEQRIESLDYDFGNFLVSAGGNLGLFLGFSCLSVLLALIKCLKAVLKKKVCFKETVE